MSNVSSVEWYCLIPRVIRRSPKVSTLKDNIHLESKLMHLFFKKTIILSPHLWVNVVFIFSELESTLTINSNFMDQESYTLKNKANCWWSHILLVVRLGLDADFLIPTCVTGILCESHVWVQRSFLTNHIMWEILFTWIINFLPLSDLQLYILKAVHEPLC